MRQEHLFTLCDLLGLRHSRIYTPPKRAPQVQITCPLAVSKEHHENGDLGASCSVTINEEGASQAYCHGARCGFHGRAIRLFKDAVDLRSVGRATEQIKALRKYLRELEDFERPDLNGALRVSREKAKTRFAGPLAPRLAFEPYPERELDLMDTSYHEYAATRNVSPATWARWGLRFDSRRQCVVFPVRNLTGTLAGLQGRYVYDHDPKSYNYPGLDKSAVLLGEQLCKDNLPLTIVEGPFDATRTDQALQLADIQVNVLATLGEGFSSIHVRTVRSLCPSVVYTLTDDDEGGRVLAAKIVAALRPFVPVWSLSPAPAKDPGEMIDCAIQALFQDAASRAC